MPWTDEIGPQDRYAEEVAEWLSYHDLLSDSNSNKLPKNVRGITLNSQLYGRVRDLVRSVPPGELECDEGTDHVVAAIYKRDRLTVLSDVNTDFNNVVNARRGTDKAFRNYEVRFQALLPKLFCHGSSLQMQEPITAFMLLFSSQMEDNQLISILAATAKKTSASDADKKKSTSSADLIKNVNYEAVGSILRQCERGSSNRTLDTKRIKSSTG